MPIFFGIFRVFRFGIPCTDSFQIGIAEIVEKNAPFQLEQGLLRAGEAIFERLLDA